MWSGLANESVGYRGLQSSYGRQSTEASWRGEEEGGGGLTLIRAEKEKGKTRYKESEGVISSTYRSRRVVSLKKNYIRICEDMAAAE